jgi:hypothetical protein
VAERRVVLHVGTMKSGTTFLQRLMFAQKQQLARAGVLVPGATLATQPDAVYDILEPRARHPLWRELTDAVRDHPGVSVISVEMLGPASARAAERVLSAFDGMDVQVVVTARDLNRTLVSMWQETIQNVAAGRGRSTSPRPATPPQARNRDP